MAITISGTTGIAGVDGSAGTPAVQGTDINTGVFYPAADTVGVSTGGSERVRVDSSGNVGIGTSSPSRKLNLKGSDVWQKFEETAGSGRSWLIGTGSGSNFRIYDETAGLDRMAVDTSGNLQFNSGYGSVATGYGCRAWVNFNGTGTVAIRASGNVSSITDSAVGTYSVNFTTSMADTNYSASYMLSGGNTTNPNGSSISGGTSGVFTNKLNIITSEGADSRQDYTVVCIQIFR